MVIFRAPKIKILVKRQGRYLSKTGVLRLCVACFADAVDNNDGLCDIRKRYIIW